MEKLVTGIHHVALKCCGVAAYEKTVDFYTRILGMEIVRTWGEGTGAGAMVTGGSGIIEIFANGEDQPGQGAVRHVALSTPSVDACVEAVRAEGYDVFIPPTDVTIASQPPCPIRMAFCIGPAGEEIEFFQEY